MRYLFVLLIVGAGSLASYSSATFAACLFLWHNIFRPQEFAYRDGFLPLPAYVLLVLIGSYAINWGRGTLNPRWNKFITVALVFMAWLFVSAQMSEYPEIAKDGFIQIIKYIVPLLVISTLLQTKLDVKMVAFSLMMAVGVWGAQAGVKGLTSGVTSSLNIRGGQMTDNNDFMVAVDSTLPLFVYFAFNYAGRLKFPVRVIMLIMLALSLCGVVFSNSRGATVGLVASITVYTLLISRRRIRDGLLILAALSIAWQFLPQTYFDRLSTIELGENQTEASAASRVELAKAAFRGTLANPIFGVGPHCWLRASLNYGDNDSEPHNVWLKCSVETGLPGLAFFLTIIGMTIWGALMVRRRAIQLNDKDTANFATAMAMAVFGFVLPSTFVSHPFSEYLWALFAATSALTFRYFEKRPRTRRIRTGVALGETGN